jgi:thiol:disulfide interchange protein
MRRIPSLFVPALLALFACDAPAITPTPDTTAPPVVAAPPPTPPTAVAHGEWNADQIRWLDYDAGLARARAERKPVCLVLHAAWCPHCRTYARVFDDPRVVAQAQRLVMVKVNVDEVPAVAARYAVDGTYVPRTYFLSPDGTILERIDAHRPQYRFFFDESDPGSVLGGMLAALSPG